MAVSKVMASEFLYVTSTNGCIENDVHYEFNCSVCLPIIVATILFCILSYFLTSSYPYISRFSEQLLLLGLDFVFRGAS